MLFGKIIAIKSLILKGHDTNSVNSYNNIF